MSPSDIGPIETVRLHGHDRAFLKVGSGPALLLIHGIGSRHETWLDIVPRLSQTHTVIAPDLLGHGRSAKPRADYSIGGYANGLRDLLTVLGVDRVTVVGHSLGGGIAMQFAYQFPERTERVVLVGTGGLGPEVNPLIPLCTLPGASTTVGVLASRPLRPVGVKLLNGLYRSGLPLTQDLQQLSIVYNDLNSRESREAFRHVLRAIVDLKGQIVTMRDRAYLTRFIPTMVIWGEKDSVIPVAHASVAARELAHARVVVFKGAGHFPHAELPEAFATELEEFIATTAPARFEPRKWDLAMRQANSNLYAAPGDVETMAAVDLRSS